MSRGTVYPFILEHLLSHVPKGGLVLETGCGGALYRPYIQNMKAGYVGTDVVNDHYQDPGDVDVHCSSNALPFPSDSFDLVFNQGAIDYMPDTETTLAEARRVLRKGGKLLIYTYCRKILEDINHNCMRSRRPWEIDHHVFDSRELINLMRAVGFRASDISGELKAVEPLPGWAGLKARLSGEERKHRLRNSIWRAYLGVRRG